MKWLLAILVLVTILVAGCTQSTITGRYGYARYGYASEESPDFQILGSSWAFEDNCQYGNESVGYVFLDCKSIDMFCEVYVNDKKSDYGLEGLQPCDHDITITDIELSEKPDFISVQSGDKWYYTRRDKNKIIEICCSHLDPSTNKFMRDNEICQVTRLDAQCIENATPVGPSASGFGQITVLSPWYFDPMGTLNLEVKNEAGQDAIIRKIYINYADTSTIGLPASLPVGSQSQIITATSRLEGITGNSYSIQVSIEYYLTSNSSVYFNSTGTLVGTYP